MGRSVMTHSRKVFAVYTIFEGEEAEDFTVTTDCLCDALCAAFPSLEKAHRWSDQELRVFAENRLGFFTISEYCDVVAVCWVPNDTRPEALAIRWGERIRPVVERIVKACFGNSLDRVGVMSNGESVYTLRVA